MKILLVTSMFPPYCGGGVSSHVHDLAVSLARTGDETYILTSRRNQPTRDDEHSFIPPGTRVIYCARFSKMFSKLGQMIRDDGFNLVHYHSFNSLALAFSNRGNSVRTVFTIHSVSSDYLAAIHGWSHGHPAYLALRAYERLALRWPDVTIAASQRLHRHVKFRGARKVVYIPNSVDCEFWRPHPRSEDSCENNTILVPCALVPSKGVEHAIRAMASILRELPDTRMVIAGDGPLKADLENLAHAITARASKVVGHLDNSLRNKEAKQIPDNTVGRYTGSDAFSFLGEIPRRIMRQLYWKANVVLIPSITLAGVQEATNIAALEAMACEKPVIATDHGGFREIISNGKDGILTPERNSIALAEAVMQVIGNWRFAHQLGRAARKRVLAEFSLPVWIERIKGAYKLAYEEND